MSRRRNRIPKDPVKTTISGISHDGRGIAHVDNKTVFIANALPEEKVLFQYTAKRSKIAEAKAIEINNPSPNRVEPPCEYFMTCGGCSLQHIAHDEQIKLKQNTLLDLLKANTKYLPTKILTPITSSTFGYRRKARLGVRYVHKKEKVLVGFREKYSNFLTDMSHCEILHPKIGQQLTILSDLISSLSIYREIPQFEVAIGDEDIAIIIRHLKEFTDNDLSLLKSFSQQNKLQIYLQFGGPDTITKFFPDDNIDRLFYKQENNDLIFAFHPSDFTQVNLEINKQMVSKALELLLLTDTDSVLDLFCGLGNFTLPIAKFAKQVVGVEGSEQMVERGYENAKGNNIDNVSFYTADLSKEISHHAWAKQQYDKVLLDPPRSGALEVLPLFKIWQPSRIVYVSCNPATLARDAAELVAMGYKLEAAGIMDMFPHTSHVESIALFTR